MAAEAFDVSGRGGPRQLGHIQPGRPRKLRSMRLEGDTPTMRQQANELLATHPDLIVVASNPAVAILKPLSTQIPVVFVFVADPVGSAFVESLARPGGNITGFTNFEPAMGGKWLELLREVAPSTTRALVLMHPETTAHKEFWQTIDAYGQRGGGPGRHPLQPAFPAAGREDRGHRGPGTAVGRSQAELPAVSYAHRKSTLWRALPPSRSSTTSPPDPMNRSSGDRRQTGSHV
jgi:ABC transporter substrate binding protein